MAADYHIPLLPDNVYHLFNHAVGEEKLFKSAENYLYFLRRYAEHVQSICDTYCYCLLPNHFHLLVRIKSAEQLNSHLSGFKNLEGVDASNLLSRQFSNFFNSYTKSFNKMYERHGSLFLKNFKRKRIIDVNYLIECILYIHLNPVKHGFRQHPADWESSSFHDFHIKRPGVLNSLFGNEENYFESHDKKIESYENYEVLERYFLD